MILTDGRFVLRAVGPDDAAALFEAVTASVAELSPWMPWCAPGYTRKEARDWCAGRAAEWAEGTSFDFAVWSAPGAEPSADATPDAGSPRLLGGVGFNGMIAAHGVANLGYWTRTDAAGRGVATAAARLTARWGLRDLGLTRVEILAAAGNVASQRVAEKLGAAREGLLRRRITVADRIHDAVVFSLVADDPV